MDRPRILIIDQDRLLRERLTDLLFSEGYEVASAAREEEGFSIMEEQPAKLVITEPVLPGISGICVLEEVKKRCPSAEVIVLTGKNSLPSAIEATKRGAFTYHLKPFDMDQLLLHVRRAMERVVLQTEITRANAELKALCDISSAIVRTIDINTLLPEILRSLTDARIFPFQGNGTLFLVDAGEANRVSFANLSESKVEPCRKVCPGECLCGIAMATGEVVVSSNSSLDPRHTHFCTVADSHGHVIVPLKRAESVVGMVSFYTRCDSEVDERMISLLSSVGNQIGTAIQNARLFDEIRTNSFHDPLTGLANRRLLDVQLGKCFNSATRYGKPLSLIMLDIDHFKVYNDTNGHQEGDRLLVKLANIMNRDMRSSDYVFRYGGEEFLIIMPETDSAGATNAAEKLRKMVESKSEITVSLGVASHQDSVEDPETLVRMADVALYRAKQRGRNRVEVAAGETRKSSGDGKGRKRSSSSTRN